MRISTTRLNLYCDCGLKYKFKYIDKIEKPQKSIHLVYGKSVHKALEELNKSLEMHPEDVLQHFHNAWEKGLEETKINPNKYSDTLYNIGIDSLLKYYFDFVDYEVISTEKEFEIEYKGHTIVGIIDAIIKIKNRLIILDYKTAKEPYSKFNIDTSIQLHLYSYAFRELLKQGVFDIKNKKENNVAYYTLIKNYDNEEGEIKISKKIIKSYNGLFNVLDTFIEYHDKVNLPNFNSVNCKWCEYKKECVANFTK